MRANHFRSDGITYHGAHSVLVPEAEPPQTTGVSSDGEGGIRTRDGA